MNNNIFDKFCYYIFGNGPMYYQKTGNYEVRILIVEADRLSRARR